MDLANMTCPNGVIDGIAQLMFARLITSWTNSYCGLCQLYPVDQSEKLLKGDEEFDVIEVGAGSAGSAIANQLSGVPSWRVLLFEAGVDPPMETNVPGLVASLQRSKYDWNYFVERSEKARGRMNDNRCR